MVHQTSPFRYPSRVRFRKITIIGVGLLGGSIGLAVKRRRLAREVAGFVRRPASLKDCEKAGAVDYATTDLLAAVSNADLVILCTPLSQMRPRVAEMLPALKRGAIVTDVGSVKAGVVRELESLVAKAGAHFVGSHPMAGAEKIGVLAARADLFENAVCVVTPTKKSTRRPFARWRNSGNRSARGRCGSRRKSTMCSSAAPAICRISWPRRWRIWFWPRRGLNFNPPLRERFSRHDAHRVRLARNVARHRAGQPQKSFAIGGRLHFRVAKIPARLEKIRRKSDFKIFGNREGAARQLVRGFNFAGINLQCRFPTSSKSSRSTNPCARKSPCPARRASRTARWFWRRFPRAKRFCTARSGARTRR